MLAEMPVPTYIGQSKPWGNLGSMENWGIEMELGWKDNIKDFSYWVNTNWSYSKTNCWIWVMLLVNRITRVQVLLV